MRENADIASARRKEWSKNMDRTEQFFAAVKTEMVATLATASGDSVTMRIISPVLYDGAILMFTGADSTKYKQLRENPHCCVSVGSFFAQATVEFRGATMLDTNAALRDAYCEKFPGAFDEGLEFGGRGAEFLMLRPTRLTGWAFENDIPTPDGIPTIPFDITL